MEHVQLVRTGRSERCEAETSVDQHETTLLNFLMHSSSYIDLLRTAKARVEAQQPLEKDPKSFLQTKHFCLAPFPGELLAGRQVNVLYARRKW